MSIFANKLDELRETVKLASLENYDGVADALQNSTGCDKFIGVGSGGSYVAASFFARAMLGCGRLAGYKTPFQLRHSTVKHEKSSIWIFSARAKSPDTLAAVHAAKLHDPHNIVMVTLNEEAESMTEYDGVQIVTLPHPGKKDGFLATHSLIMSTASILFATVNDAAARASYETGCNLALGEKQRRLMRENFKTITKNDVLVIMADPRLHPIVDLIETSVWETALCNVQVVDPRNFAHGRHTLLEHTGKTFAVMLSTHETKNVFDSTYETIGRYWRHNSKAFKFYLEAGDMMQVACWMAYGLVLVDGIACAVGVDPAAPGKVGGGRELYHDPTFRDECAEYKGFKTISGEVNDG